jgi:acetylornithine deacetylase/succinyl-diaminopimelate desuccinylase-like protein
MIARDYLQKVLVDLLRTPTAVPPGSTEIAPGDEVIVSAVRRVIRPLIEDLRPASIDADEFGNFVARFGKDPGGGVLILVYVVSQHANEMPDPLSADIIDGRPFGLTGPVARGQGASQNKGPMAAALAAIRSLAGDLDKGVTLAVNTEGASSHWGSEKLIKGLGARGDWGIVAVGTDLRISVGNRGRVDVQVTVDGSSSHSSQPWLGLNPIPVAAGVIGDLASVPLPPPHPLLGPASLTPYLFACHPVAPHTIPSKVEIVFDRRLLPGEAPHAAVETVRERIGNREGVHVAQGRFMWPALVDEDHPSVSYLTAALAERGRPPETFISLNAFDAGYPCRAGIPTVMFGPGRRSFAGGGLLSDDVVSLDDAAVAASVIAAAIMRHERGV